VAKEARPTAVTSPAPAYRPLFVFDRFGDLERCARRPGNVLSTDGWRGLLEPVIARYRDKWLGRFFRGDAPFALPGIHEFLGAEGFGYAIRLPANTIPRGNIAHLLKRPVSRPPKDVRRYYANFSYRAASSTNNALRLQLHALAYELGNRRYDRLRPRPLPALREKGYSFEKATGQVHPSHREAGTSQWFPPFIGGLTIRVERFYRFDVGYLVHRAVQRHDRAPKWGSNGGS
jgi:hypothetical protein